MLEIDKIYEGDCLEQLKTLPSESVNCCVTSPPYFGQKL
jgi:DNA modification methylase